MTASGGLRIAMYGDGQWAADTLVRLTEVGHRIVAVVLRQSPSDASLGDAAERLRVPVLQPVRINARDAVRLLNTPA